MKKIYLIIILLLIPLIGVKASSISKIDMDIYVDNNGNATIIEMWDANVNEGTEGWHPYYNLGKSKISNLEVWMDNQKYTTVSKWQEDTNRTQKAYKAGLYYPQNNEIDICFGITSYGTHTYKIKYNISNFILSAKDADIIYWTLFPRGFSLSPEQVEIRIYSDFNYKDTLDVWGYGDYGAPCYVYDGRIEMSSNGQINQNEYLTILAKFDKGTFNTNNTTNKDFNYYYKLAEKGSKKYKSSSSPNSIPKIFTIISPYIMTLLFFVGIVAVSKKIQNFTKYDFGTTGNKVRNDIEFFRDIPCNKDIYRTYWIATNYKYDPKNQSVLTKQVSPSSSNIANNEGNFLGAIILKWLKDGNVRIEEVTKQGLFKEKIDKNIVFVQAPNSIELEKQLYNYMYEASKDGILESNEFKKWCSSNYNKILKWFTDLAKYEEEVLMNEGKIRNGEGKKLINKKVVSGLMMNEAEQLVGLKKFLTEFTLIKERQPIEVNLWNEYLIYAQIFGIAEEVAKQFKNLYPEIETVMNNTGYNYDTVIFVHNISTSGISTAQSRAQAYNAGGGGFSSGGGGGGSFGGGGGGGGFR